MPYINKRGNLGVVQIEMSDGSSLDPFGGIRVSTGGNRLDAEFIYGKSSELFDVVTGGVGTVEHDVNGRDLIISNKGVGAGDLSGIWSYPVPYTPGCGQLVEGTANLDDTSIGGGEAYIFHRESVTGETREDIYWQRPGIGDLTWSHYGSVGADWSKSHIFQIDFQSLKVGRIRFGIVRSGIPEYVHIINNDNIRSQGYWQYPSQPTVYRIYNSGSYTHTEFGYGDDENGIGFGYRIPINSNASIRAICCTVKSEGGKPLFDMPGFNRSISNRTTPITVSTTLRPIISIKPSDTYKSLDNRGLYIPTSFIVTGNNAMHYRLVEGPALTGASWGQVGADSGMDYDVSSTGLTGGTIIDEDYLTADRNSLSVSSGVLGKTLLWVRRNGEPDSGKVLTLAGVRYGANDVSAACGFKWREVRS